MKRVPVVRYPLFSDDFVLTQQEEITFRLRCTLSIRARIDHSIKRATDGNTNREVAKFIARTIEDQYSNGNRCWVWPDNSWCKTENGYIRVYEKGAILAEITEDTVIDQKVMLEERQREIDKILKRNQ